MVTDFESEGDVISALVKDTRALVASSKLLKLEKIIFGNGKSWMLLGQSQIKLLHKVIF